MLVITYTSEHNHPWPTQRNALAGSTRSSSSNKPPSQKQINHNPTTNNPLFNDPYSSKTSSNSPIKQEERILIHTDDNRVSDTGLMTMTMTMTNDNKVSDTGLMTMTMTDDYRAGDTGLMTITDDNKASDTGLMTITMTNDDKVQDELIRINENDEELFNDSYRPLIMAESSTNQDFFADLGEFESDEDPLKMFNTNTFSGLFDDWNTNNNITINEDTIEKKG